MSHHLYHTEGLVIKSRSQGDANRLLYILTPQLGLVVAHAQGVRRLQSKLRYHLSDFSYVRVSLVRGRDWWRVTGAEALPAEIHQAPRALVARVASLVARLIHGEGSGQELFSEIYDGLTLAGQTAHTKETLSDIEYLLVLRILQHLGYVAQRPELAPLTNLGEWTAETVAALAPRRRETLTLINHALTASQL